MAKPAYMKEKWFKVLLEQTKQTCQAAVAEHLGYSLTAINLVINGKYPGKTDRMAQRVLEIYTRVCCPYLQQEIPIHACRETAEGRAPTHNPLKMEHWRSCLNCPKRPPARANP